MKKAQYFASTLATKCPLEVRTGQPPVCQRAIGTGWRSICTAYVHTISAVAHRSCIQCMHGTARTTLNGDQLRTTGSLATNGTAKEAVAFCSTASPANGGMLISSKTFLASAEMVLEVSRPSSCDGCRIWCRTCQLQQSWQKVSD